MPHCATGRNQAHSRQCRQEPGTQQAVQAGGRHTAGSAAAYEAEPAVQDGNRPTRLVVGLAAESVKAIDRGGLLTHGSEMWQNARERGRME